MLSYSVEHILKWCQQCPCCFHGQVFLVLYCPSLVCLPFLLHRRCHKSLPPHDLPTCALGVYSLHQCSVKASLQCCNMHGSSAVGELQDCHWLHQCQRTSGDCSYLCKMLQNILEHKVHEKEEVTANGGWEMIQRYDSQVTINNNYTWCDSQYTWCDSHAYNIMHDDKSSVHYTSLHFTAHRTSLPLPHTSFPPTVHFTLYNFSCCILTGAYSKFNQNNSKWYYTNTGYSNTLIIMCHLGSCRTKVHSRSVDPCMEVM